MNTKMKNIFTIAFTAIFLFGFSVWFLLKENDTYSDTERRKLDELPKFSLSQVMSGDYMADFEDASPDQFPLRDLFRTIKAYCVLNVFNQKDNNDVYYKDGYLSKLEYPLDDSMLDHAGKRFKNIYEMYLNGTDTNLYFSVVPDKNMFLAPKSGHLSLDYDELIRKMRDKTDYMKYIDITDLLSIDDYYYTDTHWKQEKIIDVADRLAENMGVNLTHNYTQNVLSNPFYGVYYGQSALNVDPDELIYLTSDILDSCTVTLYSTGKPLKSTIYNMEKAVGKDPYEMFLSGSEPIITIDNPTSNSNKELVMFRDSFTSSLAPLLVSGYSKITLVDTRYMDPKLIGNFVDFTNQDILFIYSTVLLNSSLGIK